MAEGSDLTAVSEFKAPSCMHAGLPLVTVDSCCFFLDIDGTLLDFSDRPDAVQVPAGLRETLTRLLTATDGAVALISGRSMQDVERLFAPMKIAAAAQHGFERRDAGGGFHGGVAPATRIAEMAKKLGVLIARHPGLLLEDKQSSLALHYRQAPALANLAHQIMSVLADELGDEFEILAGKMVVEIKPAGRDKGTAIDAFMKENPFRGRTAVFVGDDATDETGFSAINRLDGYSVKVGSGVSAARWRLEDPQAVRSWLNALVSAPMQRG